MLGALTLLAGCSHHQQARVPPPPPPPMTAPQPTTSAPDHTAASHSTPPHTTPPEPSDSAEDEVITLPADAKPLATEAGKASWYGAPYHNRRGSNGEVYNMHAMTAAHRTLPLGSIVRVTNVKTKHAALVRITDRGPFVEGRILDLSLAAAKKLDVVQPGVVEVKVEVMLAPAALDTGGRWAVQIGSFEQQKEAAELVDHLTRRYHSAKVIKFISPVGVWWVRVRVLDDDRKRAQEVAQETSTSEGSVYLVRLD